MVKPPLYSNSKFDLRLFTINLKSELIIAIIILNKGSPQYESVFRVKNNKFEILNSHLNKELISFCIESELFLVIKIDNNFIFELTPNLIISII